MPARPATARYDVHPGVAMMTKWVAELKDKTGRSLDEWLKHIRRSGPGTEAATRDWLKTRHELGTNACWYLAELAFKPAGAADDTTPEGYLAAAARYVEDLYAGPKAGLRPIHDELVRQGRALGMDVKVCPCKTIVPLFRSHVFAQIRPATKTRLDFGLALGPLLKAGRKLPARLVDTGGFRKKDRITHRYELASVADIDAEVLRWLKTAYELDA